MPPTNGNQANWNLGDSDSTPDSTGSESSRSDPQLFGFVETDIPRRRGRGWIGLSVFLVIVVIGAVALDNIARWYVSGLIQAKARSSLSLAESTSVTVTVGGTSVLYQAITGKFERLDVAIDALSIGDLSGRATLTATGVSLSPSKPIDGARVVFTVGPTELAKLLAGFTGLPVKSVKVASGALQVGTEVTALGVTVPVAIAFVPSVVDGQLLLTPSSLVVNGATLTPAALRTTFGARAEPLLAARKVCVAKYLPKQLPLESVRVSGSSLALAVSGKSVTLSSTLLTMKGVCP